MSLDDLDPVLGPVKRVAVLGMLAGARQVEFRLLRDHLGLSDSDLSKQLSALADAGYLQMRKVASRSRRRTWVELTDAGRRALERHLRALNALVLPMDVDHAEPASETT